MGLCSVRGAILNTRCFHLHFCLHLYFHFHLHLAVYLTSLTSTIFFFTAFHFIHFCVSSPVFLISNLHHIYFPPLFLLLTLFPLLFSTTGIAMSHLHYFPSLFSFSFVFFPSCPPLTPLPPSIFHCIYFHSSPPLFIISCLFHLLLIHCLHLHLFLQPPPTTTLIFIHCLPPPGHPYYFHLPPPYLSSSPLPPIHHLPTIHLPPQVTTITTLLSPHYHLHLSYSPSSTFPSTFAKRRNT